MPQTNAPKKKQSKQGQKPGFYKDNTEEVKFPDGKVRRVNKFEAEALRKKLAAAKAKKA